MHHEQYIKLENVNLIDGLFIVGIEMLFALWRLLLSCQTWNEGNNFLMRLPVGPTGLFFCKSMSWKYDAISELL
jgi:hypothetical protein